MTHTVARDDVVSDDLDAQITDFVKEFSPSTGYLVRFNELAGRLFIASEENISTALAKVRSLRAKAKTDLQRKILYYKPVAALLNLLIHEEYGHCVHHSNSAMGFVGRLQALKDYAAKLK